MGLQYGYDKVRGKRFAKGYMFLKLYDSEEEMETDKMAALEEYFRRREVYKMFCGWLCDIAGRELV